MQLWVMDEQGIYNLDHLVVGQEGRLLAFQSGRKIELGVPPGWSAKDILASARTALQTNQVLDRRSVPSTGPITLPIG